MGKQYLAFDLGASSGRGIVGNLNNEKLELKEVHRFPNYQVHLLGHYYWNILSLFDELKTALSKAYSNDLVSLGVDTWGVDFGFIGKGDVLLGNPYCYRDPRTNGIMEEVFDIMSASDVYAVTGIQFMQLNSIFQLYSMVKDNHPILKSAKELLFMPDLLNFMFTGNKMSEYTIASTSQLLDVNTRLWGEELFHKLDLPIELMSPIVQPGSNVGSLTDHVMNELCIGPVDVIAPASHDTASAIASVPALGENWAYLSSGTWSLIGIETAQPIINDVSLENNFTNEGGVDNTIRFLKNVMGMWLFNNCRNVWKEQGIDTDYAKLLNEAVQCKPFKTVIDPDDTSFLNPPDMVQAIIHYCKKHDQPVPESSGEFTRCILESLALKYRNVIEKINYMSKNPVTTLHIVGGGSQNVVLNQFTANATGLPVVAGPVEATAIGNIMVQAIAHGEIGSLAEGRQIVANSFETKYFEPQDKQMWEEAYQKYRSIF